MTLTRLDAGQPTIQMYTGAVTYAQRPVFDRPRTDGSYIMCDCHFTQRLGREVLVLYVDLVRSGIRGEREGVSEWEAIVRGRPVT